MKVILFIALTLALAAAVTPTKGEEIVKQLQGVELDGEIFVIMFYDPSCCAAPDTKINDDVKKDLQTKVLGTTKGKQYIFYEVDTSDTDMTVVLDML
jgi:hypothetical protein